MTDRSSNESNYLNTLKNAGIVLPKVPSNNFLTRLMKGKTKHFIHLSWYRPLISNSTSQPDIVPLLKKPFAVDLINQLKEAPVFKDYIDKE